MAYPAYLRERARELQVAKGLSPDEIAERLALPKTTVYDWVVDLPLARPRRENPYQGNLAMQAKYRRLREDAYARRLAEYDELMQLPTFRDFVVLYIAEGYKRDRNRVQIANSDDRVIAMAASWLTSLTLKRIEYRSSTTPTRTSTNFGPSGETCSGSTAQRSRCFENPTAVS